MRPDLGVHFSTSMVFSAANTAGTPAKRHETVWSLVRWIVGSWVGQVHEVCLTFVNPPVFTFVCKHTEPAVLLCYSSCCSLDIGIACWRSRFELESIPRPSSRRSPYLISGSLGIQATSKKQSVAFYKSRVLHRFCIFS